MLRRDAGAVARRVARGGRRRRRSLDGNPAPAATAAGAPAQEAEQQDPPASRPGYELGAEDTLQLTADMRRRPGDGIPTENQLASRRGTSRTVVREAVKILSALG